MENVYPLLILWPFHMPYQPQEVMNKLWNFDCKKHEMFTQGIVYRDIESEKQQASTVDSAEGQTVDCG
jgi:hypothetical protein